MPRIALVWQPARLIGWNAIRGIAYLPRGFKRREVIGLLLPLR
jgi:hypothetical protein